MTFDRATLERLRAAYHAARGQDQFEFDGHVLLTSYAKYLIEYLEGKFNDRG